MNLELPTVGVTTGPDWATLLNAAFTTVDAHDHTSGKGVQVPTSGLNINADLSMGQNALLDAEYIELVTQGSAPSDNKTVYVNSSNDLYYRNGSGTSVQITSGGALAATGSGVVTYSGVTTTPFAVQSSDAQKILGVNTSTAKTLNLPAATNVVWIGIKDVSGTAATNNITVTPNGSDTIDGAASLTINENFAARWLMSDGSSKWYVL